MREQERMTMAEYRKAVWRKRTFLLALGAGLLLLFFVGLFVGSSKLSVSSVLLALFGKGSQTDVAIVQNARLPRVLAAVFTGGALALSGCVMQSVLKNPMASPSTLGVSNGAVFGAHVAIILFSTGGGEMPYATAGIAFLFAMGAALLILALSRKSGFSPETVVLSGVALGALFSAGTTVLQVFATDTELTRAIFWSFGDLGRATFEKDLLLFVVLACSFVWFLLNQMRFQAVGGGDSFAKSVGVNVALVRFLSLLFSSLLCAVSVANFGTIGFVGLLAPHLARLVTGEDHRFLIPCAMLTGSVLLLASDVLVRSLFLSVSLPVGAVTSLFGAPFFLWLLLRRKGGKR